MDNFEFDIPLDLTATEIQPQGIPSTPSDIRMNGLRTAYVNKQKVAGTLIPIDTSGVIETLSMTLRVFYPLYDTADVFEYPEGTVVVVLSSFPQAIERKVQLATLYTENARFERLKARPSSDEDFLIPISWNATEVTEMESNILYHRIMQSETMLPRTILQNGMFYFFNASILFLYHHHRINIRAQDSIYTQMVLRAEEMMEKAKKELIQHPETVHLQQSGLPGKENVYFMVLCYFLWMTDSLNYPLDLSTPPDMMMLMDDLRPFLN